MACKAHGPPGIRCRAVGRWHALRSIRLTRPSVTVTAVVLLATVQLGCTRPPSGPGTKARTSAAPAAPASGHETGQLPSGTFAFDCPRTEGDGVAFCVGSAGGPRQRVTTPAPAKTPGAACCPARARDGRGLVLRR